MEGRTWKRLPFGVKHHPLGHPPLRTGVNRCVRVEARTVHSEFTNSFEEERVIVKVILDEPNVPLTLLSGALNQDIQSPLQKTLRYQCRATEEANQRLRQYQPTQLPLHPGILPKYCCLALTLTTPDGPYRLAHNQ